MKKFISVIITVYNVGSLLKSTIQSLLNQTFTNFELVIVDDGSTDGTSDIIKQFSDTRIKYYYQNHLGRSKALNYGLEKSKSDWIGILDADDVVDPRWLEIQFYKRLLVKENLVISRAAFFKNEKIIFTTSFDISKMRNQLALHQRFPHSSIIYNKNFILENGGYNEKLKIAVDYDLILRILKVAKFLTDEKILIFCRINQKSMSRDNYVETRKNIYSIQNLYYKNFEDNFGQLNNQEKNRILGWREFFYGIPSNSRLFWVKSPRLLCEYKIIFAIISSIFPISFINFIISNQLYHFYTLNNKLQTKLKNLLESVE